MLTLGGGGERHSIYICRIYSLYISRRTNSFFVFLKTMMAANQPKLQKKHTICTMKPLRVCIDNNGGDISQCVQEVQKFERTCDKRLEYVHDREGLDDTATSSWSGKKQI
eukprot:GEMP01091119.1.p1 GENE.GEMP01091119.1~~GEMP01091119.1.p1  ORF type:complete len:121 (+),score=5.25 GEMP01091119.1:36-365(+)